MPEALLHETEAVVCDCGHTAQAHHGVDPVDGCMIVGMRSNPGWCGCAKTAVEVMKHLGEKQND